MSILSQLSADARAAAMSAAAPVTQSAPMQSASIGAPAPTPPVASSGSYQPAMGRSLSAKPPTPSR